MSDRDEYDELEAYYKRISDGPAVTPAQKLWYEEQLYRAKGTGGFFAPWSKPPAWHRRLRRLCSLLWAHIRGK